MYLLGVLLLVAAAVAIPLPEELLDQTSAPELKPDDVKEDEPNHIPDLPELSPSPVSVETIDIDEPKDLVPDEIIPVPPTPDETDKYDGKDKEPKSKDDKKTDKEDDKVVIIKLDIKDPSLSDLLSLLHFPNPIYDFSLHKPLFFNHPKFQYPLWPMFDSGINANEFFN